MHWSKNPDMLNRVKSKLSKFRIGKSPWNKGLNGEEYTKHYKIKPGNSKGLLVSEETRKKMSLARKGRKADPETVIKQSNTLRGLYSSGKIACGFKKGYTPANKKYFDNRHLYRKIAFEAMPHKCNRCEYNKVKFLIVHHKDRDRTNANLVNLEILCRNCHWEEHHEKSI